jgi:hypothetical protein
MADETRKPLFRDYFREWCERMLKQPFDELTDVQRSKLMSRFFAEQMLRPRNPSLLPFADEDMEACIVDGKGDCSVDFISREDGVVLIIQAKYSGGKKAAKRPREEAADFEYFRTALGRLREQRNLEMAEPLREVAAEIDWDTDRFQMYYITLKQLAANQEEAAKAGVTPLAGLPDLVDRTELYLFDERQLNLELRDALSIDADEAGIFRIQFTANASSPPWVCLASPESRPCYVGRISGGQLAELFTHHKSKLFRYNIRNYIGDNLTNKTIRTTALESPEEFFFYNNGISALASRVYPDEADKTARTLICEGFSVINGAQTVRSLHKAQTKDSKAVQHVQTLIRITEFSAKKSGVEQEFLDSITKYNNTQNSIKLSDFRSNDKIQFDLRKKFDALPAIGGRKFMYKNKRSGEREPNRIIIGMEDFVKTVYSFLFGPDDAFGGTGHVFDATKEGGYTKLFGEYGEILPTITDERFELYAAIWFVCDEAKPLWKAKSKEMKEPAFERRWMFFYAVGESIRSAYREQGKEVVPALRALANPNWLKQDQNNSVKKAIGRHCRVAFKSLADAYKEASNQPGFMHRNWFRSQSTIASVAEHVMSSWGLLIDHGEDYLFSKTR